uniref:(northern house mosquito) hypothetical protein n=1 Tax=Culex pipiens TaxID=7175 RepID=A0A8D8B715_CULPI
MLKSKVSLSIFTFRLSTWNLLGPLTSSSLKVALNSEPRSMLTVDRASGSSGGIEKSSEILPVASSGRSAFTDSTMHLFRSGSLRLHTWIEGGNFASMVSILRMTPISSIAANDFIFATVFYDFS